MPKVYVHNPLNEDFSAKYDVNNDRNPVTFTIKAKETVGYEKHLAEHIRKALLNRIFDLRGSYKKDRAMQMKKFRKLTRVKV